MKRLLAIFCTLAIITATAMVPTVFATAPTKAVIQELPEQSALHPDPQNPYKDPTEGFYRCPVSVGENTRDAIVYEPTTSYLKMQTVFIAAPAGTATDTVEDVAQWLIDTGWVETAETHQFRIACMFTTSEWASDPADEFEYMEAVRGIIRKRVFWNAGNASFYLVGYEGGAGVTAYAAMMDPTHYAGLVTFGGKGISQDYMKFCETNCVDHEGFLVENKMRSEMDARTWMFIPTSEKNDAVIQKNIAYWKNANDVSADTAAMSSAYADEIYQEANYQSLELNEHSVGALWVTYVDSSSEYYTSGMTEQVYTQFLQKAWRFEAFPDSSLRAYEDPVDSGKLVRYTMTVDGWLREYYVYCPDSVKDSGQNVPLVICTHGSGGTGKEMFSRTEWAKVADNSGFIVVFPTSLYALNSTGAPTGWNTSASTKNNVDDVKFIRSMFEQLKEDYRIDTSRVYANGHSNGTSMAIFLGVACPDIITAVATSAPVLGKTSYDGMMPAAKTEYNTAVMVALGTNDEYAVGQEGVANIDGLRSRSVRAYWENHWGFNAEAYKYYRNGAYENYVYTNEEGQTVYRYVKVNGNLHAPLPELSYMFYEFMSQYSRGSDGALYCMGEVVNKNVAASNEQSGGSSSGESVSYYTVNVESAKNGTVTASAKTAAKNGTVTLSVKANEGYELDTIKVLDANSKAVEVSEKNGTYTFKMPDSKVTVSASFKEKAVDLKNSFVDVSAGDYYYDAVLWAANKDITTGTDATHFSPELPCSRAQIVTFLYRAAGSPTATSTKTFSDVAADAYYAKAVAWAVEKGITEGTNAGTFEPNATCTRAQAVTFLYRAAGSPTISGKAEFSDVAADAYYANAVAWAQQNNITGGIGGGMFGGNNDCTRAQIVSFLYRANQSK